MRWKTIDPLVAPTRRRDIATIIRENRVLEKSTICDLLFRACKASRASEPCPNDHDCGSLFRDRRSGPEELLEFREKFWKGRPSSVLREELLKATHVSDEGSVIISYFVRGKNVCKHFYRAASGLTRQMFDKCVAQHLDKNHGSGEDECEQTVAKRPRPEVSKAIVLGFLDSFFQGYRVQHDPTSRKKAMLHKTWEKLYHKDFKPHCSASRIKIVGYSQFCKIRKKYRRDYIIAKKYRKKSMSVLMKCIS